MNDKKNKKTDNALNWGTDNDFQGKIATMLVQDSCASSEIRLEIVLKIQHLLAETGHSLDKEQDAVLKQLLKALNT